MPGLSGPFDMIFMDAAKGQYIHFLPEILRLLKPGGVISLCIYSGGDTGYEERDVLLGWLKDVDPKKWLVIVNSYYNRRNDPPLPVFILRLD